MTLGPSIVVVDFLPWGRQVRCSWGKGRALDSRNYGGKVLVTAVTISKYYLVSEGRAYHLLSTHHVPAITSTYKMSLLNSL